MLITAFLLIGCILAGIAFIHNHSSSCLGWALVELGVVGILVIVIILLYPLANYIPPKILVILIVALVLACGALIQ